MEEWRDDQIGSIQFFSENIFILSILEQTLVWTFIDLLLTSIFEPLYFVKMVPIFVTSAFLRFKKM